MDPVEYYENPGGRGKRKTPPRGKGGRFRKRKSGRRPKRRRRNPRPATRSASRASNPARSYRRRSNPKKRRKASRPRGMLERSVGAVTKMGTLAVGGYVGVGIARAIVQNIDFVGDFLSGLNLSTKQSEGISTIVLGLLSAPLLRAVGLPARFRTPIREGAVLFGIKDLLDELVEENIYSKLGISDYLTIPAARTTTVGDYLRTAMMPSQQALLGQTVGQPMVTSYGVQVPTARYAGDPFSR